MKEVRRKEPGVIEEPEVAGEPDNEGGSLYRTYEQGYFGQLSVIPDMVVGKEVDGTEIHNRPIHLPIIRLGVEEDTRRAVGIMDTRRLSDEVVDTCVELFGEHWRPKFDKLVERKAKAHGLKKLKDVEDIQLYARDRSGPAVYGTARTVSTIKSRDITPLPPKD